MLARAVIVCAAYFTAAGLGLSFAPDNPSATPIWPPSGIALAALLVWGYRMVPGIALAAFLANWTNGSAWWVAALIAIGNTAEPIAGAWLLRRVGFLRSRLAWRDVAYLAIFAALLSTMISASVGVGSLSLAGPVEPGFWPVWRVWWGGDAVGVLLVAPALLLLALPGARRRVVDVLGLAVAAVALSAQFASQSWLVLVFVLIAAVTLVVGLAVARPPWEADQ